MRLSSLHLHQFRSHNDRVFTFSENATVIIGPNGSGKTNILEAIYTLLMGKSFRDGDSELISYNQDWYRIESVIDGVHRELRYQPSNKGKQLIVDGSSKGRFTYKQQLPIVLFEPDDLLMIHGSPSQRRKYLDDLLSRLSLPYRHALQRYERVLTQRNNLLKQHQTRAQLQDNVFVWDVSLSELGAQLIRTRHELITDINTQLSTVYSSVATKPQQLQIEYIHPVSHISETQIHHALTQHLDEDLRRGFTSVGPHRHDIEFILNGQPAKTTASRGEVRSIILSLKAHEITLLKDQYQTSPILLCDDVFSELDDRRAAAVVDMTKDATQMILTSTHVPSGLTQAQLVDLSS